MYIVYCKILVQHTPMSTLSTDPHGHKLTLIKSLINSLNKSNHILCNISTDSRSQLVKYSFFVTSLSVSYRCTDTLQYLRHTGLTTPKQTHRKQY